MVQKVRIEIKAISDQLETILRVGILINMIDKMTISAAVEVKKNMKTI